MQRSYEDRQKQATCIRREEEFRDLNAAANLRRAGYYVTARALVIHSRKWRVETNR